jgi:hypothetical protein
MTGGGGNLRDLSALTIAKTATYTRADVHARAFVFSGGMQTLNESKRIQTQNDGPGIKHLRR